ncbi:CRTAC1 family protein [Sinisalibacter aestuarii]|uniref:RNA-binding protein n=1 Tax=Sinisalibacter aestuarii TaxID=2949426 RepID=A0ABQ5LN17_9RHOB|nr:CRTAC1 family protein [Sinisalibacter aestuarii]GKY86370.1 RNA-binding protein [Sinisalibacter aestuarii]
MRRGIVAILIALPGMALGNPAFRPVTIPEHVYAGGWEHFVGGGLAVFDCDGDLFPEIVAAGGANPAALLRNDTAEIGADIAFHADTPAELALAGVSGFYPLDIDGDGVLDLAVLRVGENMLLRGEGDCRFAPFPASLGFTSDDRWTTSFSATWEAGAGLPTLAFGNYVDRTDPQGPFEACDINQLYRPENSVYSSPIVLEPGFCALSALFSDWNRNGQADLRLSNDRHYYVRGGQEQLWAMEAAPRLYTEDEGWRPYSLWGMGIASRDLTGDGLPEVYLSSMGDQHLQIRDGTGPSWVNAPFEMGATAQRPHLGDDGRPSTGWQISFGDVNNDTRDDVFIAKGNVEQMPSNAMEDPNSLLMQREDGRFTEMSVEAGVASMARSRGAALVDLNLDGRLDLAVVNRRVPMEIYQNAAATDGHWLAITLAQPGPNSQAVGAWIDLQVGEQVFSREITVGGGHASGSAVPEHFGLGAAEVARARITWPDGEQTEWFEIEADCILRVTRIDNGLAMQRL